MHPLKTAKVGDRITFRVTTNKGRKTITRTVTEVTTSQNVTLVGVQYGGWNPFWIDVFSTTDILNIETIKKH